MHSFLEAPDHVVAVRFIGLLVKDDIDASFEACRQRLAKHEMISACVDLSDFEGLSVEGWIEELKEGLAALAWMGRVERKAVITDSKAYDALVALAGSLIKVPEVKVFPTSQSASALLWAADGPHQAKLSVG